MKKIGFTLAEVLLTLSIIGVVSTMTVPSLISSIDERELQAQAKKAYNTLQSAITMKYAVSMKTTANTSALLTFLATNSDGTPATLKVTAGAGTEVVQLPDGSIMASTGSANNFTVLVDVNGAGGPVFSTATSGKSDVGRSLSKLSATRSVATSDSDTARTTRDLVRFKVSGVDVTPDTTSYWTKKYLTGAQ